jgi:Xaa-Pro aminopeptidase
MEQQVMADTSDQPGDIPFDAAHADELMEAQGLDAIVVNSPHNVRYLLGGHRFFFFQTMQAIGHSRYLPLVVYAKGRPGDAAYVGSAMEGWDHALRPFWTPHLHLASWGTTDAAALAVAHLQSIGLARGRFGVEPAFLTADAQRVFSEGLPDAVFGDATPVMERLRAVKRPDELVRLKLASAKIIDAMVATVNWAEAGVTKHEVVERMRLEETKTGLEFDYCLVTMGSDRNRAPSPQVWNTGEPMSIDSGGNKDGYIGDLCRMAYLGEPDGEMQDLLAEVDETQQTVFADIRDGATGRDILAHGNEVLKRGPNAAHADLMIHGMGLVSHEAPFIMSNRIYDGIDCDLPLQAGMVLSVETTMGHPKRGLVKLEDTVAVTRYGHELYGNAARGFITKSV